MSNFDLRTIKDWRDLAAQELASATPESLIRQTPEGIAVKPLYTAADLDDMAQRDSLPGFPPYRRGPRATMYPGRPWTVRQYAGYSTAEAVSYTHLTLQTTPYV